MNIDECINYDNLNNILYVKENTPTLNKISSKRIDKYKRLIHIGNKSIELVHKLKAKLIVITKRSKVKGRSKKYNTVEEAKEAHRAKSLTHYHKARKQYKKDIDKTLSKISNKEYSYTLANFISKHYQFNYFTTLTFSQIRLKNKENTVVNESNYVNQQDYIQNQKDYTLVQVQDNVNDYLSRLKHKNTNLIDYYFVTYQQTIQGHWHAHIALQITNTEKEYWSTFLTQKWNLGIAKTLKIRKDTPIKANTANVIHYLTEDIDHKDLNLISWDTNIDKNSKRIFNTNDLNTLEGLEYWLNTDNTEQVLLLLPHLPITQQKQTA